MRRSADLAGRRILAVGRFPAGVAQLRRVLAWPTGLVVHVDEVNGG